jgi:hypothetical protein
MQHHSAMGHGWYLRIPTFHRLYYDYYSILQRERM